MPDYIVTFAIMGWLVVGMIFSAIFDEEDGDENG